MIALQGVSKRFGKRVVLDGLDFALTPGMVTVLLGRNGAGKSTLLRLCLGVLKPDAGRVEVCGQDPVKRPRDARRLIGYVPDKQYNALYGHKQLYFVDPTWDRPVDVLVDRLEMCHRFDFDDRLGVDHPTLPLAELLLSKLQVVHINRKDVLDALILFVQYPLAANDREGISVPRITGLTSSDWGWWRTVTENLDKIRLFYEVDLKAGELDTTSPHRFEAGRQVEALRAAIDAAPKSTKWKLRARVGDRVPWYELPEEVGHGRE